ncbi:unnamed protein product [Schistocephalus solidus]|uniref:Lipase_3 domain-containing protein n=1 Tax=Schistocephalus solidus TaxID=70667 RepID=A0A183SQG2_SCHSO|nr:unnamed protein product [Schistocephalus solidus]
MGVRSTNCHALWRPWYVLLTSALEVFLIYSGIERYVAFKAQAFDPKYGGHWQHSGMNFALAMLICALFHFCLFVCTSVWRTTNLANEGAQIHRNPIYSLAVWPSEIPRGAMDVAGIGGGVSIGAGGGGGGSGFGGFYSTMNGLVNGKNSLGMMARAGTPEDEHLAGGSGAMGAGHMPLGATFDTWSARSAVPPSEFANPYMSHAFRSTITGTLATVSYKCRLSWWRRCWGNLQTGWTRTVRNFVPISSFVHLISAYALYLCLPILQAQLIYHRALPESFLHFEASQPYVCTSCIADEHLTFPRADSQYLLIQEEAEKGESEGASEIWLSDLTRLMSKATDNCERGNFCADSLTWDISVEFFNLLLAFAAIAFRYPSVFWRANRTFSFLFSLLLALLGVQALVEVSAANVLVKLCWNTRNLRLGVATLAAVCTEVPAPTPSPSPMPPLTTEIPQDSVRPPLLLDDAMQESAEGLQSGTPLFLSVSGSLLMVCLAANIFEYGLQQLPSRMSGLRTCPLDGGAGGCRAEHVNTPTSGLEERGSAESAVAGVTSSNRDFSNESVVGGVAPTAMAGSTGSTTSRRNFFAHLVAVLGSLVVLAIKVPLVVTCIQIYQVRRENLMLANVLITILFFCVWFIAWFAFCLKPSWNFKVSYHWKFATTLS